jgi:hypothetical protein
VKRPIAAALVLLALAAPAAAAAPSRVTSLTVEGRQALDSGYERVFGTVSGAVAGRERVRGLPSAGLSYTAQYELIRPTGARRVRLLLVEAENRGSPLVLNSLTSGRACSGRRGSPPACRPPRRALARSSCGTSGASSRAATRDGRWWA